MVAQSTCVWYDVKKVTQWPNAPGGSWTCWSAAAAMVLNRQQCIAGGPGVSAEWDGILFTPWNMERFARNHGLIYAPTKTRPWPAEELFRLLDEHGPLWTGGDSQKTSSGQLRGHVIVIAGMGMEGSTPDETELLIVDPWPGAAAGPFQANYQAALNSFPNFCEWVIHAPTSYYKKNFGGSWTT